MKINTSNVIESIKQDVQKKIDMEQKRLNDITNSVLSAEQFLLDNGFTDIKGDEDILEQVMITIKRLKSQTSINKNDIESINKSLMSLKGINNHIDDVILQSLDQKIREIQGEIDKTSEKLLSVNDFIGILLHLQIVCPVCNGSCVGNTQAVGDADKRFKNTPQGQSAGQCIYCDGIGVISVGKILANEELLETDYYREEKIVPGNQPNVSSAASMLNKTNNDNYLSNKYVINKR